MTFKILDPNFVLWLWNRIKTMVKNYVTTYVSNNALASTTKYALSKDVGGAAELTVGIPFGKLDETSTSTVMTATVPGITELKSGVCMFLMNGKVTSASGYTININGLGAKPVYSTLSAASRTTTLFNVAYTGFFVFNEERVEGGCWDFYYGYNSDSNTIGYDIAEYYNGSKKAKTNCQRYQLLLTTMDDMLLPIYSGTYTTATTKILTTESFNPFGQVYFYRGTTNRSAGNTFGEATLRTQEAYNIIDLRYSFNTGSTLVAGDDIYLVCVPQSDGSAKLHSNPIAKELPKTEDGLLYKRLGKACNTTSIILEMYKPVYYFKDGAIRLWTNQPAIEKSITETLGAGTALDLQDNEGTETTFFKRLSGGSNNVPSGLATIRGMKGKTVKWNQLNDAQKTIAETTSYGITYHIDDYKVYVNGQGDSSVYYTQLYTRSNIGAVKGHKYCIRMDKSSSKLLFTTYLGGYRDQATSTIITQTADVTDTINRLYIRLSTRVSYDNEVITLPQLFDLTLIFGAGNEPETVEEFEAWLAENVGLQDYYEYSEPTLLGANIDSIKTEEFNLWDGTYSVLNKCLNANGTIGGNGYDNLNNVSEYIFVEPNTKYHLLYSCKSSVDSVGYINGESSLEVTTPNDCMYVRFDVVKKYADEVIFNLSLDGSRNGEYEEYRAKTFPINITKLVNDGEPIFPYGLNRVGDVYDEIVCKNGVYKAIKRIGCVDLGTLTWVRISSTSYGDMTDWFEVKSFVNTYHAIAKNDEIHHITGEYVSAPTKAFISRILADKEIMLYTDNILYVRDDTYTTAAAFKTAMSGVLLFYELATPQEFTLNNFPCNYKVDKWGTEEMVCEGTALRPYITLSYGLNAVEKLKNFPLPPISCRVVNKALVVDNAEPYLAMGYKPMVFRWMRRGGRRNNPNYGNAGAKKYIRFRRLKRGWIPYYPDFYRVKGNMEENPLASLAYDDENGFYKLMVFDYKDWLDSDYNENPLYLVNITHNSKSINVGWGNDPKALATRSTANASWSYQPNVYMKFGLGFVKSFPDSKDDILSSELLVSNIAKFGVVFSNDGSDEYDEYCWRWSL